MSKDFKSRIEASMLRHHQKLLDRENNLNSPRRNKAPERKTGVEVDRWFRDNGFHMHEIEASIYNPNTGEADLDAKAEAGYSDRSGNTSTGLACYVELKALGSFQASKLRTAQREFLERKISQNCFAVVVDSAERLERFWKRFCSLKTPEQRQAFLYSCLPVPGTPRRKKNRTSPLDNALD